MVLPLSAVAASLVQVRGSSAPWMSIRPPQQTIAGHSRRVEPGDGRQPDDGPVTGRDRAVGHPDLQRPARCAGRRRDHVILAIEARLARIVAGLDLDQSDDQPRVALGVEPQRAGHVYRPDRGVAGDVVRDDVAGAHLHSRAGAGYLAARPRRRLRPSAVAG